MSETKYSGLAKKIESSKGKLGVLLPGMGAVSSTLIAGVFLVNAGHAKPIGSVTQMSRIRLGKRDNPQYPFIKDFAPLAGLTDIEFGGWDIYEERHGKNYLPYRNLLAEQLDSVYSISEDGNRYLKDRYPTFNKKLFVSR